MNETSLNDRLKMVVNRAITDLLEPHIDSILHKYIEDNKLFINEYVDKFPVCSLAEMEKIAILKAMALTDGNRKETAKILQIGERTLYRKIKEQGWQRIDWEELKKKELL